MPEPLSKVWRPQGFEGIEIESFRGVIADDFPTYYVTDYEFTLITQGNLMMKYEGGNHFIKGTGNFLDTLMFQHPHSTVGATWLGDRFPASCCTVKISEAQFLSATQEWAAGEESLPHFKLPYADSRTAREQLAPLTLNAFMAFDQAGSQLEREEAILRLIHGNIALFGKGLRSASRSRPEHRTVKTVKDYLQDHFAEDVTLDDLAALTCFNKYHLLQVFKRAVGVSPHVYQTSIRIYRAKQRLANSLPLTEVAYATGFVDQSHLNRQFKKYVNVTPGQFQRDSVNG
jgi:AraC-like DNA-binding protein